MAGVRKFLVVGADGKSIVRNNEEIMGRDRGAACSSSPSIVSKSGYEGQLPKIHVFGSVVVRTKDLVDDTVYVGD